MRIGQGAFERVVLAAKRFAESSEVSVEHFQPPRIERRQRIVAADQVKRSALLRARLGYMKRAIGKVHRGEANPPRITRGPFLPTQAAGDHQVKNHVQAIVKMKHDSLSQARE